MPDTNNFRSERELLAHAYAELTRRMPAGWHLSSTPALTNGPDGIIKIQSSDGTQATLVLEAKRVVESRDVTSIQNQLQAYANAVPGSTGLVVARYLSRPVQERLAEVGLSYVDTTGNVRVSLSKPAFFMSDHGADKDPGRGPGRPRGTLKGAPAAGVIRALVDFDHSWRATELIKAAGTSTGATYRVIAFLEEEELIVREDSLIRVVDWQRLLRRWSRDYEFLKSNLTTRWIAPRGLDRMLERAALNPAIRYAATGTLAAAEWAPYAPARAAMIYVADPSEAADQWDLRPADAGANVILAEPDNDVPFTRSWTTTKGKYKIAAPAQVAVDLLTGPGRNPSEGEELIGWMARNEHAWRRQK